MGTLASRLPVDIERGAEGGLGWKTSIVSHQSGHETATLEWEDHRGEWNIARAIERTGKHEDARRHLYKCRGAFHDFRFKDWMDFGCTRTGTDRGRLTGTTTTWQINKAYGTDEATFEYVRPLYRIVAGTLQVWRNAALQTVTTHYTVNMDTGVITSLASWAGDTLEVACEFDVLCRYDTQRLNARLVHRRGDGVQLIKWDDIAIVEKRES